MMYLFMVLGFDGGKQGADHLIVAVKNRLALARRARSLSRGLG